MKRKIKHRCLWLLIYLAGIGMLVQMPYKAAASEIEERMCILEKEVYPGLYLLKEGNTDTMVYSFLDTQKPVPGESCTLTEGISGEMETRVCQILLHSYPNIRNMPQLEEAANQVLAQAEYSPVENLQPQEAAMGTVQALRNILLQDQSVPPDWNTNADGICNYLLSLPEKEPENILPSPENISYHAIPAEDGKYTITVTFSLDIPGDTSEKWEISAICADQRQSIVPEDADSLSVCFRGLSAREEVILKVCGYAQVWDLVVYEGEAGCILLGLKSNTREISVEKTASPDRIINLFLTTEDAKQPVANAEFAVFATDLQQTGQWNPGSFSQNADPVAVISTNIQGYASLNFTDRKLPDGIYLIKQKENPAIQRTAEPFLVSIPGKTDQSSCAYTQAIHLRNQPEAAPAVCLNIGKIGDTEAGCAAGECAVWIIRSEIPAGISGAEQYRLSGFLPAGLSFEMGSLSAELTGADGTVFPLQPEKHYSFRGSPDAEGSFVYSVALTEEGVAFAGENRTQNAGPTELRMYYKTGMTGNLPAGACISNQVTLHYRNGAGISFQKESDCAYVFSGGVVLQVTDTSGNPAGAGICFRIARELTDAERQNPPEDAQRLTINGKKTDVIYVPFHRGKEPYGKPEYLLSFGENGRAEISSLAWGTYYLVRCTPGTKHISSEAPIRISVHKYSHFTSADGRRDDAGKVIDNTVIIRLESVLSHPEKSGSDWLSAILSFFDSFRTGEKPA